MNHSINLCTSVLRGFTFDEAIDIASSVRIDGIELRVSDDWHVELQTLERSGASVAHAIASRGLRLAVLNSYIGIDDDRTVHRLLLCAQRMEVPFVRLVLPRAAEAAVANLSLHREVVPSYHSDLPARELIRSVRRRLRGLATTAVRRGVRILLELHWGTIMSSFTAAALLLEDIDPAAIGLTFDPANMVVEGREDQQFGLHLNREYVHNVHVKNAMWTSEAGTAQWNWAPMNEGMVDWWETAAHLRSIQYAGAYAIEDFLTPRYSVADAIEHLRQLRRSCVEFTSSAVEDAALVTAS